MSKQTRIIGSVQRAIDIINLFDRDAPALGVTEIARALGLPKSTAAGIIFTLEQNGYLDQNPETRKYRLGSKLAERARVFLNQFDLREIAGPILENLRTACNESVNLAIRDGDKVLYIERMHGDNMLGMRSEIGKRECIHSTALGKAILSCLPSKELKEFLNEYEFVPVTSRTITDAKAFSDELKETRRRGFALDDQENELGGRCVAAPIFDNQQRAIAAISLSIPIQRFPDEKISDFGSKVREAARKISERLGAIYPKDGLL